MKKAEKEKQPEGAFLIGEMQKQDNEEYIYIYGAIKIKELKKEGGEYLINAQEYGNVVAKNAASILKKEKS